MIEHVKNQEEHHKIISLRNEFIELLRKREVEPARRQAGLITTIYCEFIEPLRGSSH